VRVPAGHLGPLTGLNRALHKQAGAAEPLQLASAAPTGPAASVPDSAALLIRDVRVAQRTGSSTSKVPSIRTVPHNEAAHLFRRVVSAGRCGKRARKGGERGSRAQ
jgi:hypothetical protein